MEAVVSGARGQVDPAVWKGREVLVTGHTGFKGGWLVTWLRSLGAEVHGLSLAPERDIDLYDVAGLEDLCASRLGDIRDLETVRRTVAEVRPSVVFHLAAQALVRRGYARPVETMMVNVMGTAHVLDACRGQGVEAVVVVTTDKVYDNPETGAAFRESDPLGGNEPYALSKAAAELMTQAWRDAFLAVEGVAVATARAGNVIGGGDWNDDRLVPDAMRAFLGGTDLIVRNPDATRPWQHVVEPLAGYLVLAQALLEGRSDVRRGWNFGPGAGQFRDVGSVVEALAARWGEGARWRVERDPAAPHESRLLALDSSAAGDVLGWAPRTALDEALDLTVDWYRAWAAGASPTALRDLMLAQVARVVGNGG